MSFRVSLFDYAEYEKTRAIVFEITETTYSEENIQSLDKDVNQVFRYVRSIIRFISRPELVSLINDSIDRAKKELRKDIYQVNEYPDVERVLMFLMDMIYDELFEKIVENPPQEQEIQKEVQVKKQKQKKFCVVM